MGQYLKLSSEKFDGAQTSQLSAQLKANLRRSSAENLDTIYTRYKVKLDAKKEQNQTQLSKVKSQSHTAFGSVEIGSYSRKTGSNFNQRGNLRTSIGHHKMQSTSLSKFYVPVKSQTNWKFNPLESGGKSLNEWADGITYAPPKTAV